MIKNNRPYTNENEFRLTIFIEKEQIKMNNIF